MRQHYSRLRELLRGQERQIAEYMLGTTALFILSLFVIRVYVDYYGLDEWAAKGATSATMLLAALPTMFMVWRKRQLAVASNATRFSVQRVAMTIVPQALYLMLVGAAGLPYFRVQLAIAVFWGLLIAFPLNYALCHLWSMKETDDKA